MVSVRSAFRKFFDRVNSQLKEILVLLDDLEAYDFLEIMEQFNKRNKFVKELIRLFSGLSGNIRTSLERRNNAKIQFTEMFEPKFFDHYRNLLKRAAKFLPEGMVESLLWQLKLKKI